MAFVVMVALAAVTLFMNSMKPRSFSLVGMHQKPYPVHEPTKPKTHKPDKGKGKFKDDFALVKMSGIGAVAASGKIGGTVFNEGGVMGSWLRNWAKPKNRRTTLQQNVRAIFGAFSSAWRTLSAAQVLAWNEQAQLGNANSLRVNVFGDVKKISGLNMFKRINEINTIVGNAPYLDPPLSALSDAILTAVPAFAAGAATATISMTDFLGGVVLPANTSLVVEATAQLSSGRSFFGSSQYRLIGFFAPATSINPLNVHADYIAKFGALVVGSQIGIRMYTVYDDGAGNWGKSGFFYCTATVAP